jgi:molybdate transport system substrate-binding protein
MADLDVLCSGGFKAALLALTPSYESASGDRVRIAWGGSVAGAASSIPARLARGEPADVVIMASAGLERLGQEGRLLAGRSRALARSGIGVAVRRGAVRPDISSVAALKRALLAAAQIAISRSASGIYLEQLFCAIEIGEALAGKLIRAENEPVGAIVARGEAEIGLQQVSELLPVAGLDYLGPLPPAVQETTVFAAGVGAQTTQAAAASELIAFLAADEAAPAIERAGMEPVRPAG